jgi:hypothetical protein
MRDIRLFLAALILAFCARAPACANYWKIEGPATFAPCQKASPAFRVGETRPSIEGEGSRVTVSERSTTSAAILSVSSRSGVQQVRFTLDTPADTLHPRQRATTRMGWETMQKWSAFSPAMLAELDLDESAGSLARGLPYGWPSRPDLTEFQGYDGSTRTVTAC